MKHTCEICGRELGFFERSLNIENTRLGLSYQTLCADCYRDIQQAVDKIATISAAIADELRGKLSKYRYAAGDVNVLIFLAVKEIFEREPDFDNWEGLLVQTFFPEEERRIHTRFDYLELLTFKVLRNGFSPVLGRYGLDTLEAFIGYMGRECFFEEQVLTNCAPDGAKVYTDLFLCPAGLVFYDTEDDTVRTIFVSRDRTLPIEESHTRGTYDVTITRQRFHKLKEKPVICFNRKDQRKAFVEKVEAYNQKKEDRIQGELTNLINNLNVTIERDLRSMHPFEEIDEMPLDSVLVSIIKTLFEQDIEQEYVKEAPDGLLNLIVERCYQKNLENSEVESLRELQDYIADECVFVRNFQAAFGKDTMRPAFAFLTPRAYMIKQLGSTNAFLNVRQDLPNDLYTDYQYMIYQGKREFYITTATSEKNDEGYYILSGVRIQAKDSAALSALEDYFSTKALDYYRDALAAERAIKDSLREQEILDAARRIFVGFGYLPFCIYDEWAEIERILRQGDLLMADLIPEREPKTGTQSEKIFYAGKTVNSYEQEAARLAESFEIKKIPVARGLLWGYLKDEILKVCAEEFVRLCGDILTEEDDLESAFLKYSKLTNIQPEKAYYLGLFIYYLMDKGYFERTDFLDQYDAAAKMYIKLNPKQLKQIEFSELDEPARSFDTEVVDFRSLDINPQDSSEEDQSDSFYYSVHEQSGDTDSIDQLVNLLNESLDETEEPDVPISERVISTRGDEEEIVGAGHLENIDSQQDYLSGIDFIDVNSSVGETVEEKEAPVIKVEELKTGIKRSGFDSVREIIGLKK